MIQVYVTEYNEVTDIFTVHMTVTVKGSPVRTEDMPIPGSDLPRLIGECGEPSELLEKREFPLVRA